MCLLSSCAAESTDHWDSGNFFTNRSEHTDEGMDRKTRHHAASRLMAAAATASVRHPPTTVHYVCRTVGYGAGTSTHFPV